MGRCYPRDAAARLHAELTSGRERSELASWGDDTEGLQRAAGQLEEQRPIPSLARLEELLECAFFASLMREEGIPVLFSLFYMTVSRARALRLPVLEFRNPIGLSPEQLRKLSPASGADDVEVGVYEYDGELRIWGLVYLRGFYTDRAVGIALTDPSGHEVRIRGARQGLTCSSRQPGVLIVRDGPNIVMTYDRGEVSIEENWVRLSAEELAHLLHRVIGLRPAFQEQHQILRNLVFIANVALEHGTGATILVVPAGTALDAIGGTRYELIPSELEGLRLDLGEKIGTG